MIKNAEEFKNVDFDIIVLTGQSNAEGNGVTKKENGYVFENTYQLEDTNVTSIAPDIYSPGATIYQISMPTVSQIVKAYERKNGEDNISTELSSSFAGLYEKNKLEKGRKLLILKAAVGGSGFSRKEWGRKSMFGDRMAIMINDILALNPNNKIVCFLWHQGEHDAYENAQFSKKERYDFYYAHLKEQFEVFREFANVPIIAGKIIKDWGKDFVEQISAIEEATQVVCDEIGNAYLVDVDDLISNDQEIGNGDNIHFSYTSCRKLGEKYYRAYEKLSK